MPQQSNHQPARRLTARGIATRARIVSAADELIRVRGVNGMTLDEVTAASGSSKSQLYHHFADKESLVHAVIASRGFPSNVGVTCQRSSVFFSSISVPFF